MKHALRLWMLVVLILVLSGLSEAQGAGVKKFPGEATVLTWTYAVIDEANCTGYRIYQGLTATGPFTFTNVSVAPSLRTVTIPATFSTGSVIYFYTARAYFTGTAIPVSTVESVDSNAVEVDRNVVTPVGLLAK